MSETDLKVVVVGVDGSPGSRAALAFAAQEAMTRGCTLEVVTTWQLGPTMSEFAATVIPEEERARAQLCQDDALAEVLADQRVRPVVSQVVLQSPSGQALVEAAHDAAMLVVGSGRKSALTRVLLGSVSEYCVRHSRVPVVVVPDPARLEPEAVSEELVEVGPATG